MSCLIAHTQNTHTHTYMFVTFVLFNVFTLLLRLLLLLLPRCHSLHLSPLSTMLLKSFFILFFHHFLIYNYVRSPCVYKYGTRTCHGIEIGFISLFLFILFLVLSRIASSVFFVVCLCAIEWACNKNNWPLKSKYMWHFRNIFS